MNYYTQKWQENDYLEVDMKRCFRTSPNDPGYPQNASDLRWMKREEDRTRDEMLEERMVTMNTKNTSAVSNQEKRFIYQYSFFLFSYKFPLL